MIRRARAALPVAWTAAALSRALPAARVGALLWALAAFTTPAPVRAQSLEGRVVHGVTGAAVPGARVELHRVTAEGGSVADSARSGDDGGFRFSLSAADGAVWLAAARYRGVLYFGPALHAPATGSEPYDVAVYDTTTAWAPPADVRVAIRQVVVAPAAGGGLDVAEVFDLAGRPDRTLVPGADTVALWAATLPDDASGVQPIEGGVPAEAIRFGAGGVELHSVLSPLGARVAYTYRVEGDELDLPVEHPTDRVELVIVDLDAEVRGAVHAETAERAGRIHHRYEGLDLAAGDRLRVRRMTPGGLDIWVLVWAAGGLLLLVAAYVVHRTGGARTGGAARGQLRVPGRGA